MKPLHIFVFLYSFYYSGYSQKNGITIIEEATHKRTFIYAENKTEITKIVFLRVEATGYRRRSDRPTLDNIPPKSKKLLTTLIPLTNTESKYTFTYVVNDQLENIHGINVGEKK